MCDSYYCDNLTHNTFRFYLIDFQLNTDFPSQFCGSLFLPQNHLALLKDQFLKKMLLKRAKTRHFFFFFFFFLRKTIGSNNSFTLIETISGF